MKTIFLTLWRFLTKKEHLPYTILGLIIVLMGTSIYILLNRNHDLRQEINTERNLNTALADSVTYYQNEEQEWVAEKLTIQTTLDNFKEIEKRLTANQQRLLAKVEKLEEDNHVIAAALIETQVKIDSLSATNVEVDTTNKTVTFSDSTKNIDYEFVAENVIPAFPNVKPTLDINKLLLPNEQFINFHWRDDKKVGYPIAFSVTNSNDYFKTTNINSYAIPELNKNELDPTGWQRFTTWTKKNGKYVIVVGVTTVVVGGVTYVLTR